MKPLDGQHLLIPRPRECRLTVEARWVPPAVVDWIRAGRTAYRRYTDPVNCAEGVRVVVRGGQSGAYEIGLEGDDQSRFCDITASSVEGLRNAFATLNQLLDSHDDRLPFGTIIDSPAFATRGVMLDVSRDKVPTMAQLKATADLLASLKFNHLQLYTEHAFAYRGHEEVWADASPLTPDEVRELDGYCAARGVELAANQNCFGHLAVFLKRATYNHLAEIEGDNPWKFMHYNRRGPFSLCPLLPESEAFVRDLLGQLLPCFSSGLVNIGCDETFDVGWGRSKAEVERRAAARFGGDLAKARADLFFEFVNKVCAIAHEHGKRPQFWADIAISQPEMLARLPKDAIGLAWGYEPDAKFAEECRHLREHGLEAWVCPGTSSWRTFAGRTTESRGNIAAAAEQGMASGATGFLVCDWGDVGHMQQWPLTLARLPDAAEAAWRGELPLDGASVTARDRAAALHIFGDSSRKIVSWLNEFGDVDLSLRRFCKLRNASAVFNDLFPPVPPPAGQRSNRAPLEEFLKVREAFNALAPPPRVEDESGSQEIAQAVECVRLCIEHGVSCRRSADGLRAREEDRTGLRELAESVLREHRRLWVVRNRPGGVGLSSRHLERVVAELGRCGAEAKAG